jgi:hypothetical protein
MRYIMTVLPNRQMARRQQFSGIASALVGIALVFAVTGCNCDGTDSGLSSQQQFDSAAWRQGDTTVRGEMARDLVSKKHVLIVNKTKSQIRDMLGAPDTTTSEAWEYTVDLGQDYLGESWMYTVKVLFGEQEKAVDALLLD